MKTIHSPAGARAALLLSAAVTTIGLVGCLVENPNRTAVYRESPSRVVYVQDDYVYYPQYEMYYSSSRHQYGYRSGNSWVWQASPSHVSINMLVASPFVQLAFHDSPEKHHSEVIRSYPKNWKQPEKKPSDKDRHSDDQGHNDHKH